MIRFLVACVKRAGGSETLIVNTLCTGIGALGAWNAYYVIKYWHVIVSLYWEAVGCLRLLDS